MKKKIIRRERRWFSAEKLIISGLIFAFFLAVCLELLGAFSAISDEETEMPAEVSQQISVLTEVIHRGRRVREAGRKGFVLLDSDGKAMSVLYDNQKKRILLDNEVLLTDITSAHFVYKDIRGAKATDFDGIRTIRIDIVHVENKITGRVKRHKIEARLGRS